MNKQFAWFLGTLLSDGSITTPKYRKKGDETHIQYCIHIKDVEMLYKIKNILNTNAAVKEYPDYKSPQCKIRVYDRKDITRDYKDIKSKIPEDINGFERHFIRGIVDGDGCMNYRKDRKSFRINIINEKEDIIDWCSKTISKELNLEYKKPKFKACDNIYIVEYEGRIAQLIAWWLYHGNIQDCRLERKFEYYKKYVLDDNTLIGDNELLYAVRATYSKEDHITPNIHANKTLDWCHRLQKQLSFNTVPVFHNKGKTKYYELYIP